jgi:methyl-accepting chemotaxis protein
VARHVSVELVDDIDGSPAAETVDFGLDGVLYTIDLSRDNAAQLRSTLRPYVRKARETRTAANAGTKHRRRAAANTTALIRDLAERAKDQHRGDTGGSDPQDEPVTERTSEAQEAPAAAEAVTNTVSETEPAADLAGEAAAEPADDQAEKAGASLPLAPIFQPPQR